MLWSIWREEQREEGSVRFNSLHRSFSSPVSQRDSTRESQCCQSQHGRPAQHSSFLLEPCSGSVVIVAVRGSFKGESDYSFTFAIKGRRDTWVNPPARPSWPEEPCSKTEPFTMTEPFDHLIWNSEQQWVFDRDQMTVRMWWRCSPNALHMNHQGVWGRVM